MTAQAQPNWKKVGRYTPMTKHEKWQELPILPRTDPMTVIFKPEHLTLIHDYTEKYFDKATIDKRPSQWQSSKGDNKTNANETGIIGEWAGLQYLSRTANIVTFLADRPWKMSDMGDALMKGKKPRIIDYKTATWRLPLETLMIDDTYFASMDAKFADRQKYGYLDAFIFCVFNPDEQVAYIMGWMLADEFFAHATRKKQGEQMILSNLTYSCDTLLVPYRRLRSIRNLVGLPYHPMTESMTKTLRGHWETNRQSYDAYIAYLSRMLSSHH